MKIFLIGLSGVGKSTLGKQLSSRLVSVFLDLDQEIEKTVACTIPDYFIENGEKAFREKEKIQLRMVQKSSDIVLATGAGTPCFFNNMDYMLQKGVVIYLELPVSILAKRLQNSYSRPLLITKNQKELEVKLMNQLQEREKIYKKAHLTFNMKEETLEDLVIELKKMEHISIES